MAVAAFLVRAADVVTVEYEWVPDDDPGDGPFSWPEDDGDAGAGVLERIALFLHGSYRGKHRG